VTEGADLAEAYLKHHFAYRPVDATFMGIEGYDAMLPDASAGAAATERLGLTKLAALLDATPEPDDLGARLDRRTVRGQITAAEVALDHNPRFLNPAWYTGEAAFGVIGLLLPQSAPTNREAVKARLLAVPDFLADGRARLSGASAPRAWSARAKREAAAISAFLRGDIRLHNDWDEAWAKPAEAAANAFTAFGASLDGLPDRPMAIGGTPLERLMRDAHGLTLSADEAVRRAEAAFDRMGEELVEMAARIDPGHSWSEQIGALSRYTAASPDAVIEDYRCWNRRAATDSGDLLTTETGYGLEYRWLAPCFRNVAKDLYFLFYRSPPAATPGEGSVYWVNPPGGDPAAYLAGNAAATVKTVHAVHHGSVGHHTQNAAARRAASRLARVAGTDCALGIAFLSSGSMVEGWACYVQDMMKEAPGFYTPAEELFLKQLERRNAASVLVDIRLHTGEWSPEQAIAFYREKAGFAAARVESEVTRNSMLPATRLMYWLGIDQIRALRTRWRGETRDFHDRLIGYGHVPVAWAGEEMARAGLLD
jgi:hypothetical protein